MLGMLRCLAVSVLCLTVSSTTAKLVYKDEVSVNNKYLVYDTVKKFFKYENKLVVMVTENSADYLAELPVPAVILTVDNNCDRHQTVDHEGYVVYTTTNNNSLLNNTLNVWKCFSSTVTNLKTKRVLIVDVVFGEVNHTENYLSYFHHLWREFSIIHVVILQDNRNKQEKIFAYNPFQEDNLVSPRTLLEFTLSDDFTGLLQKRLRNLNGHSLKAGYDHVFGNSEVAKDSKVTEETRDLMLKRTFESKINTTFDITEASTSDLIESFTRKLPLQFYMVEKYNLDYYIAITFVYNQFVKYQLLSPRSSSEIGILVHKSRRIEGWEVLFHIYQWEVCLGVGLAVGFLSFIAILFWKVLAKVDVKYSHRSSTIAPVCKAVLSYPVERLPTSGSQRALVALSLVFGTIIVPPFFAQMYNLIKVKPRLPPINNFDDFFASEKPLVTTFSERGYKFNTKNNTIAQKFKIHLIKFQYQIFDHPYNGYEALNFFTKIDGGIVYTKETFEAQKFWYKKCMSFDNIHSIKEAFALVFTSYVMPADSIYFDSFNDINLRLSQSGLFEKWPAYSQNLSKVVCDESLPKASNSSEEVLVSALAYTDLLLPFYVIYGGLTISTLCFIVEILLRKVLK